MLQQMAQLSLPRAALALLALALASCERYPEDPESSLERALAADELRVGAISSEPWVKIGEAGQPMGVEAALISEFARELGLEIKWKQGGAEEQLDALERFELDVVIGGLTRANPWRKRVGFTAPYYTSHWLIGVSPSKTSGFDPSGVTVRVRSGNGLIRKLEKKGAVPKIVEALGPMDELVAAEAWEIAKLGLYPTDVELRKDRRAMAVAPGENALLTRLDKFLIERADKDRVESLLRAAD